MTSKRSPELQAVFDLLERSSPYASIEQMNRLLAAQVRDYNARPQADLGRLSPDAMSQLLCGDWVSEGALRLNDGLSHEELVGAAILADTRMLLEYIRDEGPVTESAARNLPRAVVAALLPRLRMVAQRTDRDFAPTAHLNEGDVRWLPALRHLLMFGGLLARRKGLRITPRGRAMLSVERENELYALLFRTLFLELDLRALGGFDDHARLQGTVAFSFYQLRSAAREWASAKVLARTAWLESAKDPLTEWAAAANVDYRYFAFERRVLDPLAQFGLLERRIVSGQQPHEEDVEYRCAPLFDRFLRFEFESA